MAKGKIKWYNRVKGYGFITPEDGSKEVYLHHSVLQAAKAKAKEGDEAEYEQADSEKGPKAASVKITPKPAA